MSFLIGLRPEFDPIRSQLLNESAIPSLQETFARILRHKSMSPKTSSASNSALISRGGFRGGYRGGHRGGHRGGSEGSYTDRRVQRVPTTEDGNIECYYCHELGHTKFTCKKRLASNFKTQSAHLTSTYEEPTATFVETGKSVNCLLSYASKWVIDSGASDHMTGSVDEDSYW
ncbi:hypothetical protein SSX86_006305 [Deinandra increscens subsp. villosa]|uniref:CCHC-type domain-containing protein n=1 Tax=Deinandra increscens subsp. villosa TaxID=3103831 RepID=A0AAP0H6C1_9ASTR